MSDEEEDEMEMGEELQEMLQRMGLMDQIKATQEALMNHHKTFVANSGEEEQISNTTAGSANNILEPATPSDEGMSLRDEEPAVSQARLSAQGVPSDGSKDRLGSYSQARDNSDCVLDLASSAASSNEPGSSLEGRSLQRFRPYNAGRSPPSFSSLNRAYKNNTRTFGTEHAARMASRMRSGGRGSAGSAYPAHPAATEMFGGLQEVSSGYGRGRPGRPSMPPIAQTQHRATDESAVPSMEALLASLDEMEVHDQPKWRDSGRRVRVGGLLAAEPEEPRFGPREGEENQSQQVPKVDTKRNEKAKDKNLAGNAVMTAFAHTDWAKRSVVVLSEQKPAPTDAPVFDDSRAMGLDDCDDNECRLDPDTGQTYTWHQFKERFSGELAHGDILTYWRDVCQLAPELPQEPTRSTGGLHEQIREAPGSGTMVAVESIEEILARLDAEENMVEEQAEARHAEQVEQAILESSCLGRVALAAIQREQAKNR